MPPDGALAHDGAVSRWHLALLVTLAMAFFAANSLLCRMALKNTAIDAATFTSVRIASGAAMLWLIVQWRGGAGPGKGSWLSALALFVYAAGFSFAYLELSAAMGALILFCAVQVTMIGYGVWTGERMYRLQVAGLCLALAGLVGLLMPGLSAPPLGNALLMLAAGAAWGVYSLRGRGQGDPTLATAGNFMRAIPIAVLLSLSQLDQVATDSAGFLYAVASGGLASGIGYAVWYRVLPSLRATNAATIQLSVPVIAAVGGVIFLGEAVTARLIVGSAAILGGIALVVGRGRGSA